MTECDPGKILRMIKEAGYGEAYPGRNRGVKPWWSEEPFHVLVATVLSQRTRDENTFNASDRLFSRFPDPEAISKAPLEEIIEQVRPAGFPSAKGRAIKEISRRVVEEYSGRVPEDLEVLMGFPMVGRKTANCVLAYAFGRDAICVDTHVHRISNRLGLVTTRSPDETEMALREAVPKEHWRSINRLMVVFGQKVCRPRVPLCDECPVNHCCDYWASSRG
jgi:endonuclease-3